VISQLDLVITVDTLAAHLAGAMGVPAWVMLQYAADWRWMTGRSDSPWYPSLRLFRQPTPGDWASVVCDVEGALRHWLRSGCERLTA
jgi:ADP-heptose:LPS heptosyltransferase